MRRFYTILVILLSLIYWISFAAGQDVGAVDPPGVVAESNAVEISDSNLASAIRSTLGLDTDAEITSSDMLNLSSLRAKKAEISDLSGLEHATHLTTLNLSTNSISNLSPLEDLPVLDYLNLYSNQLTDLDSLSGLESLTFLDVGKNEITDIEGLADLTDLRDLYLDGNKLTDFSDLSSLTGLSVLTLSRTGISDLSVLGDLTSLTQLYLTGNAISDISALSGLTKLGWLFLAENQISDVSPLVGMADLISLRLLGNPVSNASVLYALTQVSLIDVDIEVDTVPPSVSIAVPSAAQSGAFDVVITFSEVVSDFLQADLTVSGTATATVTAWLTTDDTTYTATITPTTGGEVVVSVAVDVATDAAGNSNTASESQTVTVDMTAPEVSISVPEGVQTEAFDVTITFTESVSGFQETDLSLGSNTGRVIITAWESTDDIVYIATIALVSSGDVTFQVPGDVATDAAGNANTASNSENVIVQDNEAETVWMPDAKFRNAVRKELNLAPNETLTKTMVGDLNILVTVYGEIGNLTGLEYAINLTGLFLTGNPIDDLTPLENLTSLTHLELNKNRISDLSPLERLTSLTVLDLDENSISDISSLEKLTSLTYLYLDTNSISDISSLEKLTSLTYLYLGHNSISDIDSLKELTSLTQLDLYNNSISDVSPLEKLTNLNRLWLADNPILDVSPLYWLLSENGGSITTIDIVVSQYAPWDVNKDENVDASDVALVTAALGQSGDDIVDSRTDVNGDGTVDADDLTLVTDNLDADDEAAPGVMSGIASLLDRAVLESLDPETIAAQLSMLRSKSDGSLKYQRAIALLESTLAALRPVETLLLANYPNPFNPETWIPYHLANAGDVGLTIYDVRGTVVRRLDLGHQREGYYTSRSRAAYWDGKNEMGERVASGVYFYQLEADNTSLLRKMVILK